MTIDVEAIRKVESAFYQAWDKFCQLDDEAVPTELRLSGVALKERVAELKTEMEHLRERINELRGMI